MASAPPDGWDLFNAELGLEGDSALIVAHVVRFDIDYRNPPPYYYEYMFTKARMRGGPPPPPTRKVQARTKLDRANVRLTPKITPDNVVAQLPAGTLLTVEQPGAAADKQVWDRIAEGVHRGRYIAESVLSFL